MLDLFKQFFSFKKFMKDRLVTFFFYLGLIVIAGLFFSTLKAAFCLMEFFFFKGLFLIFIDFFFLIFLFVGWRLICELMVTIFHINNNLSPDGGKSDLADIDPFETAREAVAKAAKTASDTTRSAIDKTKTKIADRKDNADDEYADYEDVTPPKKKTAPKKKPIAKKPVVKKSVVKKTTPKKTVKKTASKKRATKPKK
ncbi:MAG: DUF4282 domain-containing protein [Robiginitomaculum sp.]